MRLEIDYAKNRMRVPILLPTGRDAELVSRILAPEQIAVIVCESMHEMLNQVRMGCGPFVLGDEALSENALYRLMEALDTQPDWSNLPGLILIGRSARRGTLDLLGSHREISLIQRPIKKSLFINMMQTAVEARKRQYQVGDLLDDLVHTNEKLNAHTTLLQKLALELTRVETRERQRIARILHDDLQQLLASAKLQTEMLFDYVKDEPAQKVQMIYDIIAEAMKASRSLSHELNPAFVHGENLGEALKKLATRMAENYGFRVQSTIGTGIDQISKEIEIFVYQSMQELLFNCAKHAEASWVSLEITSQGKFLTTTMTDDGVGFDPADLKIYGGDGGGFGLYSIQQRVMALGGSFKVHSSPNKGSRFVLKIPPGLADKAGEAAQSEKAAAGEDMKNDKNGQSDVIRVIIADDHAVMRQGLASLLQNQPDIEVVAEAADGEQAVALAIQLRPTVVLMDFSMPLLNGTDATRRIKNVAPEIAVIGLSMHAVQEKKKKMLDAGAQTYLTKDVQAKDLIATIKEYADHQ